MQVESEPSVGDLPTLRRPVSTTTAVRPPLRWAGSKRALVPQLRGVMPDFAGRYIEPFAGSACLFFATQPPRALLADYNADLVATLAWIRDAPGELYAKFSALPNDVETYQTVRSSLLSHPRGSIERASAFFYLNRYGFNGVYRTNRRGEYNVPRGTRTGLPPTLAELLEAAQALTDAEIACQDFRITIASARAEDFLYLDPPYSPVGRRGHGEYGYGSFAESVDLTDLLSAVREAHERGCKILISYGESSVLASALPDWHFDLLRRRRNVAGKAAARVELKTEVLARNYAL